MTNEDILKQNSGKKFDIVLMNPPYGNKSGKNYDSILHIKFVNKCLNICKYMICIMPYMFIKDKTNAKEYRENISNRLINVEEVNSILFNETNMANTGIYVFNEKSTEIKINNKKYKSLIEYDNILFDNDIILNNIYKLLNKKNILQNNNYSKLHTYVGKYDNTKIDVNNIDLLKNYINDKIDKKIKEYNKIYMIMTTAAGTKRKNIYKLLSGNGGKIFNKYDDLKKYIIDNRNSSGYHVLIFNNLESANNFLIAIKNNVLQMPLIYVKKDFNITKQCYSHIPDIDWSDDRVKTDEGLLEVCGCPKDKCKEYADYCKKIIEQVDNK